MIGDEQTCEQCTRRGILLAYVDGNGKLPKYLCDLPHKAITVDLDLNPSSLRIPQHSERNNLNIIHCR